PHRACRFTARTDHFSLDRPFQSIRQTGPYQWRRITSFLAKPPHYGIVIKNLSGVSLVLSPEFCGDDAFDVFVSVAQEYRLELLDILPQDLNVEKLREVRKRFVAEVKSARSVAGRYTGRLWQVPRGILRLFGRSCRTVKQRQTSSKELIRIRDKMIRVAPVEV